MMLAEVADAPEQGEVRAGDRMSTAPVGDDFVAVPLFWSAKVMELCVDRSRSSRGQWRMSRRREPRLTENWRRVRGALSLERQYSPGRSR